MRSRRQAGLTLAELLVAVSILGIVAIAAVPNLSSTTPHKLDLAAEEIAGAIRFARSEALRLGQPYGFLQPSGVRRIRLFSSDTVTTPPPQVFDVYHPVSRKLYDIELDAHSFAAAESINRSGTFRGTCTDAGAIVFDRSGTPWCNDPRAVLLEQLDITVSLNGFSRVVTLHGVTGKVTVQ
jgi:prepilin-type N-terminal cleavage/methylation domain-containing protein